MRSYRPDELFDADGALMPELRALAPAAARADGRQPARQRRPAARGPRSCPTSATTRSPVAAAGRHDRPRRRASSASSCATSCARNPHDELPPLRPRRDRLEPAGRGVRGHRPGVGWPRSLPVDEHLAPDGRVMEILSEHTCQGWLEGYLLTGRHGLFSCYEAFIHIIDSMFNQHAKWLKITRRDPLAAPDRLAQLPADDARLAPGPQRLQPPGPGLHRPRREQEGRASSASTCRPTRTRCCRSPTIACAAATT